MSTEQLNIVLSNAQVRLELNDQAPYGLRSLKHVATGREILAGRSDPLYRLTLSRPGGETRTISSADAREMTVTRAGADESSELTLRFGAHGDTGISVVCRVSVEPDSALSRWRIEVNNDSSYAVRGIEYPVTVVQCADDASDGAAEYFVWGFMGGQTIQDPARNLRPYYGLEFCRLQYPGVVSVQFQAFHGAAGGAYLATEDASGAVKRFGATVLADAALDLTLEHNYDETVGRSFELPYDTVLGTFEGDWYEPAGIYKAWAVQQPWCSQTTAERTDIPAWIKEPRPWLCIISRGNYDRLRGTYWGAPAEWPIAKFWPAKNVIPLMRDFSSILETPVVTWMEGWEETGAPSGPVAIFPPLEGAESFAEAMATLTADGNLPFGYLAGLHWTYKRPNVGYSDRPRFEIEGKPLATINPSGEVDHFRFVSDQKIFANLCIASPATLELYLRNFSELMDLGLIALQIDQQIGLYTSACYSEDHGHPPGYGAWMFQSMLDFVREVRTRSKARNSDATFGYEVPCEIWIQDVDVHMHRPYHIRPFGVASVPLFDYLYHAFALSYGGDTYMGLAHPEVDLIKHAYVTAFGVQNLVGIGQPEWDYEVNPDYPTLALMRSIVEAQRSFAHEFLVLGDMLRPTRADCASFEIDLYKHASWTDASLDVGSAQIPACVHSVWRGESGNVGHILVNWTGDPQKVTVELVEPTATVVLRAGQSEQALEHAGGAVDVVVGARKVVALVERRP